MSEIRNCILRGDSIGALGSIRVPRVLFGVSPNKVFRQDAPPGAQGSKSARLRYVSGLERPLAGEIGSQRWQVACGRSTAATSTSFSKGV